MSTLQRHRIEERFMRNILVSFFFHFSIALFFSLNFYFLSNDAVIVESAVRVDLVGLPDKFQQLPQPQAAAKEKNTEKASAPQEEVKPSVVIDKAQSKVKPLDQEPVVNLKKTKTRQKQALDKIKALETMEKMKKEISQQVAAEKYAQSRPIRGNILSAGAALTGVNQLQYEQYFGQLDVHIKSHWSLPEFLQNRGLRTQVKIQFDENGYILSKEITLSSGNVEYDNFVLETIEKSSPLPAPPEKFQDIVKHRGILIGFPE